MGTKSKGNGNSSLKSSSPTSSSSSSTSSTSTSSTSSKTTRAATGSSLRSAGTTASPSKTTKATANQKTNAHNEKKRSSVRSKKKNDNTHNKDNENDNDSSSDSETTGTIMKKQAGGSSNNNMTNGNLAAAIALATTNTNSSTPITSSNSNPKVTMESLKATISKLEEMLHSESQEDQLRATKLFRELLSGGERDPLGAVQDILDRDIVPQLLTFLEKDKNPALQVEALWALTNIAAGTSEHTQLLINSNAVPTLVSLLDSPHQDVLEQAVWVLGNIAGDGTSARDAVLNAGALDPLLKCLKERKKTSLLRIASWTLSNLCDGQPRPVFQVDTVLESLREVLTNKDTEILSHACWALNHLCDGPSPHIEAVVRANVCQRLVELLDWKSCRVVKPALRTVGNIVCAEDEQDYTQQVIECGAVPCLRKLILHTNREIQKEACWTLSNIAAGTIEQIQCVLDSGSIPTLIKLASKNSGTDPDVKIEACWVLLNTTSCGSDSQIEHLVRAGCVSVLCDLLNDNSMVMMALEGLEKILQVGRDVANNAPDEESRQSMLATMLETKEIAGLQKHRSSAIAKRAQRMWEQYFVTCAICETPFSKTSSLTKFCTECKCHVCHNCDCTVYHLSYQEDLWKDLAKDEKKVEQSKKSKKKKKRQKDKKRREMQKAKTEAAAAAAAVEPSNKKGSSSASSAPASTDVASSTTNNNNKNNNSTNNNGATSTIATTTASPDKSKKVHNDDGNLPDENNTNSDFTEKKNDQETNSLITTPSPSKSSPSIPKTKTNTNSTKPTKPTNPDATAAVKKTSTSHDGKPGVQTLVNGHTSHDLVFDPVSSPSKDKSDEASTDYVGLLSNSGSILAVWEAMKEEEDPPVVPE